MNRLLASLMSVALVACYLPSREPSIVTPYEERPTLAYTPPKFEKMVDDYQALEIFPLSSNVSNIQICREWHVRDTTVARIRALPNTWCDGGKVVIDFLRPGRTYLYERVEVPGRYFRTQLLYEIVVIPETKVLMPVCRNSPLICKE